MHPLRGLVLATCLAAAPAGPVAAGEVRGASDPCGFYRGQAYGRGLSHFATEMLWACEAIEARRVADLQISARLAAVATALERYRLAVISEGSATFARGRASGGRLGTLGADQAVKAALAESSGALAALDSVRAGY